MSRVVMLMAIGPNQRAPRAEIRSTRKVTPATAMMHKVSAICWTNLSLAAEQNGRRNRAGSSRSGTVNGVMAMSSFSIPAEVSSAVSWTPRAFGPKHVERDEQ